MTKPVSRQLAYKRRQIEAGKVYTSMWAHPDDVAELRAKAAELAAARKGIEAEAK